MKKTLLILASFALALCVKAEPATLSNAESARLFAALRSVKPGLTAANARAVALDINLLRPAAEAAEAGSLTFEYRKAAILQTDPQAGAKFADITKEAQQFAHSLVTDPKGKPVTFTFFPLDLSEKEQTDAQIAPDALAEFIRFLSPPAKK